MKKVLLIAVTAFVAVSVSAQSFGKKDGKLSTKRSNKQELSVSKASVQQEAKKATEVSFKHQQKLLSKKIDFNNDVSIKAANNKKVVAGAPRKAGTVQPEYTGSGTVAGSGSAPWTMRSGTFETGELALTDVIPNISQSKLDEISVEYTLSGNTVSIAPQLVFTYGPYYVFIFGESNTITMTLGDDGSLTLPDGETIYYGAFTSEEFDSSFATYAGYFEYVKNIKYLLPGQEVAPVVEYMPAGLNLYANITPTFYGYSNCLGIIPPFATVGMKNYTTDPADSWSWSVADTDSNPIQTSTERDFTFETTDLIYNGASLIGTKGSLSSDPFVFGTAQGNCEGVYLYAGYVGDFFQMDADQSYSIITPANPDNEFAYYSGYATPDKNSNRSITTIAEYMGKPEAPLYIEGVNFLVRNFEVLDADNFNLKCKIVKATMHENGWPEYGDVIAEADLNLDDVVEGYSAGSWTAYQLNWNDFYTEDESGMSVGLDYIFIEDEFAILIEGWDNGTFSVAATYGEYNNNNNAPIYTFFTKDGEEMNYENEYRMGYQTHQLIGFNGAAWGYMNTEDETDLTFAEEGETKTIHIEPMLYSSEGETLLDIDENSELPEWISLEIQNEVYTSDEQSFDLAITAEPLNSASGAPRKEEAAGRTATFTVYQPGAKLDITVTQGTVTGISDVKVTKTATNGKIYNIAGQRINKNAKGIIVKDGKKFIVK